MADLNNSYEYFAFISYKREDEKWAKWLQRKLEYYKLPSSVRKDNPELPEKIRPVFKDTTDLEPGVLAQKIQDALDSSKFLIVICSPRSSNSVWVSKEVQSFIDSGRSDCIIPFIIGGTPNASNPEEECFPEGLRQLTGEQELLGANINEMGREAAAIKVVACMFGMRFDTLWQRYRRSKFKIRIIISMVLIVTISSIAFAISTNYIKNVNRAIIISSSAASMAMEGDKYGGIKRLSELLKENLPITQLVESNIRRVFSENNNISLARIPIYSSRPQVAINPSIHSKQFVYGDDEGIVHLINLENGNEVTNKRLFESEFSELLYNEKGDLIIASSNYNGTRLLNGETLVIEDSIPLGGLLCRDKDIICLCDFLNDSISMYNISEREFHLLKRISINGRKRSVESIDISMSLGLIAFGFTDKTVSLWTITDQNLIWKSPPIHKDYVTCVQIDEKNNQLISCGLDGKIIVWDIESGKEIIKPFGHNSDGYTGGIYSFYYFDNEQTLFTASSDRTIGIWNLEHGQVEIRPLEGHSTTIRDIDYKKGYIVSASENDEIRIWNYNCIPTYKTFNVASSSSYLHKGVGSKLFVHSNEGVNQILYGNDKVTNACRVIKGFVSAFDVKFFSNHFFKFNDSDYKGFKSYELVDNNVSVYSFTYPEKIFDIDKSKFSSDLAILSEGGIYRFDPISNLIKDSIEVARNYYQICFINNHEVIVSNFDSIAKGDFYKNRIIGSIPHNTKGRRPFLTKHSKKIAVGYVDGVIKIIDVNNLKTTKEFKAHSQPISYLEFNDDGSKLISISSEAVTYKGENNVIKIWDVDSECLLSECSLRNVMFNSAIFDEQNSRIIASDNDGNIYFIPFYSIKELLKQVESFMKILDD